MHRRKLFVLALAAVAMAAVGLTGASGAPGQSGRLTMLPGGTISGSHLAQVPLALSNKMVTYILEMSAKPVIALDAASKAAGQGALSFTKRAALTRQISSQQAPVIAAVQQLHGAQVTARFQGVYNGISVTLPQRDAWKLSSISGVKAVYASKTYKRAAVLPGDGIPVTNAPQAWGGVPGFTGAGMKIAVLDTGIDYTHADFGGSGSSADYQCALANDTADPSTVICGGHPLSNYYGPTAPKVKGGIDLVGDCYGGGGAGCLDVAPHPDNNPLDCQGHGTHTAGTAAGFGVDTNGNTYAGSYNQNTINDNPFRIAPGMAPQADIYAVRIFGCQGGVDDTVLINAMNWAFTNGMDVVNMSLGSPFGSPTDPGSVAASNLASDGVITVVASGNSGPNPYITSSPAAGIGTLSVAANDTWASIPGLWLTLTKADTTSGGFLPAPAQDSNGVAVTPGPFAIKVITTDTLPSDGGGPISRGCSVADDGGANSLPPNTYIVVRRGTCARVAKAIYGQQAGAAGVIMVNNNPGYPPYEGPITKNPDDGSDYTVTIPFLGVQGGSNPSTSVSGLMLRAADGGTVVLGPRPNPTYKALAYFSSWGPSRGILKPDVTAPGVNIVSAGMGTGSGGAILSGTSMATPHTAGEALLVKQAHPTWGAVQFWKDAIVNTANSSLVANYAIRGAGAGEIDAYNATHTQVVADGSPAGTASLSFGVQDATKKVDVTLPITLHNFSSAKATFVVSSTSSQGVGHKIVITTPNSWAPGKVVVPAHGTASVSVELIVDKGKSVDPVAAFHDWWCFNVCTPKFDDAAGLIHFRPIDGSNHLIALNVPYYAVPTAVSSVAISGISSAALKNGATDGNVVLTNPHSATGHADWFSWGGTSPVAGSDIGSADLLNDGVQSFPTGNMHTSLVVFGLQTTKSWTNPAEDTARIDVNVDGPLNPAPDYAVYSYNLGGLAAVAVCNYLTSNCMTTYLSRAMFNGTTMELPVRFSDLCQSGAPCVTDGTAITYQTYMQDRNGGADAITSNRPFDVFHPSLLNNGSDTINRGATVVDPTTIDPTAWAANPQLGLLVLMQNNQNTVGEAKTFSLNF